MSAIDTLRRAEALLRDAARTVVVARTGSWEPSHDEPTTSRPADSYDVRTKDGDDVAFGLYHADAAYIALMDPLVGLALADWLRVTARTAESMWLSSGYGIPGNEAAFVSPAALALAQRLLGEEDA